jgi:hypothetical protein
MTLPAPRKRIKLPFGLGMIKISTIFGKAQTPYMKRRLWTRPDGGDLRFHTIYRGDEDRDPHSHPFGFWTFPLQGYWEEFHTLELDKFSGNKMWRMRKRYVKPFRLHYRPKEYVHRILPLTETVRTIVWTQKNQQEWGFWVNQELSVLRPMNDPISYQRISEPADPWLHTRKFVPWREYLGIAPGSPSA